MSDEELSIAKAAAELSAHFRGCLPAPDKAQGGLIETSSLVRAFPTEESFDGAMRQHAFEGIEEAELGELGLPVEAEEEPRKAKKKARKEKKEKSPSEKSSYARKKERRLAAAKEAERAAFVAEARRNAQHIVAELRAEEARQREIQAAIAATPKELPPVDLPPVSDERRGLRTTVSNLTDPDRMHRRFVRSFGIRP